MRPLLTLLLPCFVVLLLSHVAGQSTEESLMGSLLIDKQLTEESIIDLRKSLRFEPSHLDFGQMFIGTARSHTVTLINQNSKAVYLNSVSGSKSAFYSSFFEVKVVPPLGNTTFNVVFLPRDYGAISTDLLIHTSFGLASLSVQGEGRECPYRLKPLVGIKAPLNATLTPEILMYNPHERPLQILEVYSSGGQFQLELPSGGQEGPQTLWEIPPHSTKTVIRIRFHGRSPGNYTAYIRIKISTDQSMDQNNNANDDILVIPVEFEILPQGGIYAENPVADFGRITTQSKVPLYFELNLKNSYEKRPFDVISYKMRKISGVTFSPSEARFILDPQQIEKNTVINEVVVLKSTSKRNSSLCLNFTVLLRAEIFKGNLNYDRNVTKFVLSAESYFLNELRHLVVRNNFEFPVTLWYIALFENDNLYDLNDIGVQNIIINKTFEDGTILNPGKEIEILQLQLQKDNRYFITSVRLFTNVTNIDIPVVLCSGQMYVTTNHEPGRLSMIADESAMLNLGAIPLSEMSHDGYVVLHNRNPIDIKLSTWDFISPRGVYFHTTFLGCLKPGVLKEVHNATLKIDSNKFHYCTHLKSNDLAVFQVAIQSFMTDHTAGTLKIWTEYETITIFVKFRTWRGKLEVDQEKLYFQNCFPGKMCVSDLSIKSTFQHAIHVTSINFSDIGVQFVDYNPKGSLIRPQGISTVGRILFEPSLLCQNRCYIPPEQDEASTLLAFPLPLNGNNNRLSRLHFDETELRRRTELFRHLKWYFQTISFTLNSEEVKQFLLQLIIDIEWPKLVITPQKMLTIETGKQEYLTVAIKNPADSPILVDYFLSDPQDAYDTQVALPPEVIDISTDCYLTDKPVFLMIDPPPMQPILLEPQASIDVRISFDAIETGNYCTLLHIRNNLTLYEAVWLNAKAVQSKFRFGNRKPGCDTPLLFELNEKHFSVCNSNTIRNSREAIVKIKRTFTARNSGEIPIRIESFFIGNSECEGYGFKVLDCGSFELKANSSKRIEIAFTPDFTTTRMVRPLMVKTNLTYDVGYMLVAQMPTSRMEQCIRILPRPKWENRFRSAGLILLITMFVLVLTAAHVDYSNIIVTQSALYLSREKGPIQPTFNLQNIALRSSASPSLDAWANYDLMSESLEECVKSEESNKSTTSTSNENNKAILKKRNIRKSSSGKYSIDGINLDSTTCSSYHRECKQSNDFIQQNMFSNNEKDRTENHMMELKTVNNESVQPLDRNDEITLNQNELHDQVISVTGKRKKQQKIMKKIISVMEAPNEPNERYCKVSAQRQTQALNQCTKNLDKSLSNSNAETVKQSGSDTTNNELTNNDSIQCREQRKRLGKLNAKERRREAILRNQITIISSVQNAPTTSIITFTNSSQNSTISTFSSSASSTSSISSSTTNSSSGYYSKNLKKNERKSKYDNNVKAPIPDPILKQDKNNNSNRDSNISKDSSEVLNIQSQKQNKKYSGLKSEKHIINNSLINDVTVITQQEIPINAPENRQEIVTSSKEISIPPSPSHSSSSACALNDQKLNELSDQSSSVDSVLCSAASSRSSSIDSASNSIGPSTPETTETERNCFESDSIQIPTVRPSAIKPSKAISSSINANLVKVPNTDDFKVLTTVEGIACKKTPINSEISNIIALKEQDIPHEQKGNETSLTMITTALESDKNGLGIEMLSENSEINSGINNFVNLSQEQSTCSRSVNTDLQTSSLSSINHIESSSTSEMKSCSYNNDEFSIQKNRSEKKDISIDSQKSEQIEDIIESVNNAKTLYGMEQIDSTVSQSLTPTVKKTTKNPAQIIPNQINNSQELIPCLSPVLFSPASSSPSTLIAHSEIVASLASLESKSYDEKNNAMEFGPIGSRKSPSSTPIWEPIVHNNNNSSISSTNRHQISHSGSPLHNNNSFFSNIAIPTTNYPFDTRQQYISTSTGQPTQATIYELKKAQEEMQYILHLQQQQLEAQAHLLQGVDTNWSNQLNAHSWSPLHLSGRNYGGTIQNSHGLSSTATSVPGNISTPIPSWNPMASHINTVVKTGRSSNSSPGIIGSTIAGTSVSGSMSPSRIVSGITSGALGSCINATGMSQISGRNNASNLVRPPPGLETTYGHGSPQTIQHQQQNHLNQTVTTLPTLSHHLQHQQHQHRHQHQQHLQQNTNPFNQNLKQLQSKNNILFQTANITPLQHHNQQDQQHSLLTLAQSNPNEIQPYDPFSSLSSIWSQSWKSDDSCNNRNCTSTAMSTSMATNPNIATTTDNKNNIDVDNTDNTKEIKQTNIKPIHKRNI